MASIINADTSSGLKLTSDTSGIVEIQNAGTTKLTVNSSGATVAGTLAATAVTGDGSGLTGLAAGDPSAVKQSFELDTGGAVTAGRGVSVGLANGKVGLLPVLNAFGTNANIASGVDVLSQMATLDGGKRLTWAYSGTTGSRIVTFTGSYLNAANPPTGGVGSTTITNRAIHNTGAWNYDTMWAIPIDNDRVMVSTSTFMSHHNPNNGYLKTDAFVVTIADNGNLTKGNVITNDSSASGSWPSYRTISLGTLGSINANSSIAFFAFGQQAIYPGAGGTIWGQIKKIFKVDGTTLSVISDSGGESVKQYTAFEANLNTKGQNRSLYQSSAGFSMRIGSKILRSNPTPATNAKSNAWVGVSDFNTSTGQVGGTVTYQEVVTAAGDNLTGTVLTWTVIDNTHVMCSFADASGLGIRYNTYSINTSGVLTKVYSWLSGPNIQRFDLNNTFFPNHIVAAGTQTAASLLLSKFNTMSLSATGEILGMNVGVQPVFGTSIDAQPWYRDGYWILTTNSNGQRKAQRMIINAATTPPYTHVGFASATSSSGTQEITVAGVATGFSGLTIGTYYWTDTAFTGQVSLINTSGNFVGTAISATEILLNRREVA